MSQRFASFREFYPFYLAEHGNRISRRLHFIGSCGVLALLVVAIAQRNAWWLLAALPLDAQDHYWDRAKAAEKTTGSP